MLWSWRGNYIGTIESPSQNSASSSPKLSGPSSSSPSAEERRVYACQSNVEEKMLLRLWAANLLAYCHHRHIFSPSATLIVEIKSLLSGCAFKFSVAFLLANLKTLPKCDPYLKLVTRSCEPVTNLRTLRRLLTPICSLAKLRRRNKRRRIKLVYWVSVFDAKKTRFSIL